MSNQLMNPQDFVAGLTRANDALISTAASMGTLLRLLKSGFWVYGAEDVEVEDGSLWAINPASLRHGYCAWSEGELVGEVMVNITAPPVVKSDLEDVGAPWKAQLQFDLKCVSGEDKDTQVTYKCTSVGGLRAGQAIIASIIKQISTNPDKLVPVVTLASDSYKHKEYGRVYTPLITIQKWVGMDGFDLDKHPVAVEEEEKPKLTKKKKAAPVVEEDDDDLIEDAIIMEEEEEEEAPAPARRRRRG